MKIVQIGRSSRVDPARFAKEFTRGEGRPLVVTDAMEAWPARSKWTFEFFRATFGTEFATATSGLDANTARLSTLAAYIDFVNQPGSELPGFWVGEDGKPVRAPAPDPVASPLYLMGWRGFERHPELHGDIEPAPYFVSDLVFSLDTQLRKQLEDLAGREFWSVYIGTKGSLSALHRDFWHTHSTLSQVCGRKRAMLFPPSDSVLLQEGRVDPEEPDFAAFPALRRATMHECIIGPGDVLYIPPDWWHCVRTLEASVTVSHNFFNESNLGRYLAAALETLSARKR